MGREHVKAYVLGKAEPAPNRMRYKIGQKRCTFCGIFLDLDESRCIYCEAKVLEVKYVKRQHILIITQYT